jgi:hypothetical protein
VTDQPSNPEPVTDTWNVRLVILALGVSPLVALVGSVVLAAMGEPAPEMLKDVALLLGGALGAMLASTRSQRT